MDAVLFRTCATTVRPPQPGAPPKAARGAAAATTTAPPQPPRSLRVFRQPDGSLVRVVRAPSASLAPGAAGGGDDGGAGAAVSPAPARRPLGPYVVPATAAHATTGRTGAAGGPPRTGARLTRVPGSTRLPPHLRDHAPAGLRGDSVSGEPPSTTTAPRQALPAAAAAVTTYSRDELERLRLAARRAGFPPAHAPPAVAGGGRMDVDGATAAGVINLAGRPPPQPQLSATTTHLFAGLSTGADEAGAEWTPPPPVGAAPNAAVSEAARKAAAVDRKATALELKRREADARDEARWAAMEAAAAATAARTAALQASGTKARRNRSGASYDLLTLAPRSGADAAALQAREAAAAARHRDRCAALAAHATGGEGYNILTGAPVAPASGSGGAA